MPTFTFECRDTTGCYRLAVEADSEHEARRIASASHFVGKSLGAEEAPASPATTTSSPVALAEPEAYLAPAQPESQAWPPRESFGLPPIGASFEKSRRSHVRTTLVVLLLASGLIYLVWGVVSGRLDIRWPRDQGAPQLRR